MKLISLFFLSCFLLFLSCKTENEAENEELSYVEFGTVEEIYLALPDCGNPQCGQATLTEAAKRQKARLAAVLAFYNIPFQQRVDGKIMIPGSFLSDTAFAQSLLNKAADSKWTEKHLGAMHCSH